MKDLIARVEAAGRGVWSVVECIANATTLAMGIVTLWLEFTGRLGHVSTWFAMLMGISFTLTGLRANITALKARL